MHLKLALRIKSLQVAVSSNVNIDSTRPQITLRIRDVVKMGPSVSSMSDNFHAPEIRNYLSLGTILRTCIR